MTRLRGGFAYTLATTLRVYIDNGWRVDPTARALGVHPNTLRYRIRRYEDVTGVRLDNFETAACLWWAL